MDAQELSNLQEAYMEVYASPEELDERLRRFPKDKVWAKQEKIQSTLENNPNLSGERLSNRWSTMDNVRQDMNNPRNPISQHTPPKSRKKSLANKNRPEHEKRSKTVKPRISFPNRLMRSDGQGIRDSYDIYDVILSHLLDEGYAETVEAAEVIMVNMSEDWREDIVEAQAEVLAPRNGVAGSVKVNQTRTPGFLGTGIGSRTISTPIPGTWTRETPGRRAQGPRQFDAYGSGSKGAEAEMSDKSGPTDAERGRFNQALTSRFTVGDKSVQPSPRAVNRRAAEAGHSGLMPERGASYSTKYEKPNQSWRNW